MFSEMNAAELESLLNKLKKELEEVEEERMWVLKQTGRHIPGETARKYEAEVDSLKSKITEIENILQVKKDNSVT